MYSLVTTIGLRFGAVVDGITIEKGLVFHPFGFFGSCLSKTSCVNRQDTLDEDEKVQSITYGRSVYDSYLNFICKLSFHTNKRVLGPFSTWRCSEPIYRVDIPSEMMLLDFFNQNLKTKLTLHRESGNYEQFFDGFNSEYTTS